MKDIIKKLINKLFGSIIEVEIKVVEVKVEVLSQGAYDRLAKGLEGPIITGTDSPQSAGYKLGIQRALTDVRSKFTS
ncbi:hypothetical protein FDH02_gp16 [Pseudomonas phage VSW-3]|uniref:Uncharacterized protein n=1 Tax=Pseudomonas phage VSW-3 TaxID=1852562 RepID=A0A173GCN9_9CAUD|nr:hypothetical protein FDH02_gp16 [Pseudomonas phage VSW-3]ANH51092.1 hypothetical protein VSW3_16 [Pseudomonas phage VSW-3]